MQNIADLVDPDDKQGRTYREVNNAKTHSFAIGVLVEIDDGVRLFVAEHNRDCDGTPLYSLTAFKHGGEHTNLYVRGICDEDMKAV